jgi:nicotinamidase/pyrazinamidase
MEALLVVDIQNDFCPGGALPVPEGDQIVPVVNRLAAGFNHVLLTQDWHPAGHRSFASRHPGRRPYEVVEVEYGPQVLWPDHCVQGTQGAEFHPDFESTRAELILRKGFRPDIDSYSAFFENDKSTPTGLAGYLRDRGIHTVYLCGLATDFCVLWSSRDGRRLGLEITVIEDATRGIDIDGSVAAAFREMKELGCSFVTAEEVLLRRV